MQQADIQRFEWFKKTVDALGIRHPVAEIAEKTGADQGNISSYLNGKKTISNNFLTKFKKAYNIEEDIEPTTKQILAVLADAFKDQAGALKLQADIMKNIEKNMARADAQATMATNLNYLTGVAVKISDVQDRLSVQFGGQLSDIQSGKKGVSSDVGSKPGQNDGAGQSNRNRRAKRN